MAQVEAGAEARGEAPAVAVRLGLRLPSSRCRRLHRLVGLRPVLAAVLLCWMWRWVKDLHHGARDFFSLFGDLGVFWVEKWVFVRCSIHLGGGRLCMSRIL